MYSPEAGDAAFDPKANIDNEQMSKKRFILINEQSIIYAGRENAQVERALPLRFDLIAHQIFPRLTFPNQPELVSPH
jgi:hypothetical protein